MPGPGGGAPRLRVALVHWDRALAADAARRLRAAGFTVAVGAFGPATLRAWRARPPAAVVIDLSRGPMQGRDVGLAVRNFKATRGVALVFAGGAPEKVARVRASGIPTDLSQAAVRRVGLAAGLVDYRVCAIDATWTGLKFALRKPPAGRRARTLTWDSLAEPGPRR